MLLLLSDHSANPAEPVYTCVYICGGGKCLFNKGSLRGGSPSYFPGEGGSEGERAGALSPPVSIN